LAQKAKKRIVLDTNILISAFVYPGGAITEIMDEAISGLHDVFISYGVIEELSRVLMLKFEKNKAYTDGLAEFLASVFNVVPVTLNLSGICRDPMDDKILAAAVEHKADYIITGDKDILELKKYKGIIMVTASDFIKTGNL
jgi:putative PIN family toxin of toxin-antitoxin system